MAETEVSLDNGQQRLAEANVGEQAYKPVWMLPAPRLEAYQMEQLV